MEFTQIIAALEVIIHWSCSELTGPGPTRIAWKRSTYAFLKSCNIVMLSVSSKRTSCESPSKIPEHMSMQSVLLCSPDRNTRSCCLHQNLFISCSVFKFLLALFIIWESWAFYYNCSGVRDVKEKNIIKTQLCHLLLVWPWVRYLTSLCLGFLIFKMGIILHQFVKIELDNVNVYQRLTQCWEHELSVNGCKYYDLDLDMIQSFVRLEIWLESITFE